MSFNRVFFFFKQKTAYEMRISDWSSDVCSSDLHSVQGRLLRSLVNRLRMLRDFAAHPEIREQSVREPIFVAGYLRTGSTKLVRMLAASGDFNDLPLWKARNPSSITGIPGEDPGARIADRKSTRRNCSH